MDREIARIAIEYGLRVADAAASPEPGDFWIGTHPNLGWADADLGLVGWASTLEAPLALRALRFAARQQFQADHPDAMLPQVHFAQAA